jgi:hypothetical protein
MEKQGMGRRGNGLRAGLLISGLYRRSRAAFTAVLFLAVPLALAAQWGELELSVHSSPETPEAGGIWTLTILADHPVPGELNVELPGIPFGMVLERTRISPHINPDGKRRSLLEYVFSLGQGGAFTLAPFRISVPGKQGATPPLTVLVSGPPPGTALGAEIPRLFWDPPPDPLPGGEASEIPLRIAYSQNRPSPGFGDLGYTPEPPPNAIVEVLPGGGTSLLRLRVIPLGIPAQGAAQAESSPPAAEGMFIKAGELTLNGRRLPVPALELPVLAAALPDPSVLTAVKTAAETGKATGEPSPTPDPLKPVPPPAVFPPVSYTKGPASAILLFLGGRSYRETLKDAAARWEQGSPAEALALLRKGERDLVAGPLLSPVRRSLEKILALGPADDEPRRPLGVFLALGIMAVLLLTLFVYRLLLKKGVPLPAKNPAPLFQGDVTSRFSWGYKIVIFLLSLLAIGAFAGYTAGVNRGELPLKGRRVLVREGTSFRAPEQGSSEGVYFREGELVRIREAAVSWFYVESNGERAGWVPEGRIVLY